VSSASIEVRLRRAEDSPAVIEMCRQVYPQSPPWTEQQLASHVEVFPEGQMVAVDSESGKMLGMASSLVILWDDYEDHMTWRDFTEGGTFRNHDAEHGRTLYGAEVMVAPNLQGRGVGKALYQARRDLAERLGLLRIRAGARLRGYHDHAEKLSPEEYVVRVIKGEIGDPTLSFQLKRGFHVLGVVNNYLRNDPESLGYAAIIEWINREVARPGDYPKPGNRFAAISMKNPTETSNV
jgi:GNAT superfamily N-acetyltransferase